MVVWLIDLLEMKSVHVITEVSILITYLSNVIKDWSLENE